MKILVTLVLAIVLSCVGVYFGTGAVKTAAQVTLGISGVTAVIVLITGAAD